MEQTMKYNPNDTAIHATLGRVKVQYDYGVGVCVRRADKGYCVARADLVRL
jgi:hypothetical protein